MHKRLQLTEKIMEQKIKKNLKWSDIAAEVGVSKEWLTTALLGQMAIPLKHIEAVAKIFDLTDNDKTLLNTVPYKGSLLEAVPTDPCLYRLYEVLSVFGSGMKELIHEEFGDGIMSAIDFNYQIEREENPKGDRVKITLNGKFLPYKEF